MNIKNIELSKEQISGYEKILPWFINVSKNNEFIKSFWLHGSRCVNQQTVYSDLDIAFIVNSNKDKDILKKKLKSKLFYRKFYDYFKQRDFEYWEYKKREVGIHIYSLKEFKKLVKSFFNSIGYFEKNQGMIQHIFVESKLIYDPLDIFLEAKEYLLEYPEKLRKELIELTLKRIWQEVEWWTIRKSWKNIFEEMKVIETFIDEVTKCHYALNKLYRKNFLKQYLFDIKKLKPNLEKEIMFLSEIMVSKKNDKKKIIIMNNIFKKLNNFYK